MNPIDLYAQMGLDPASLASRKGMTMIRKHAVRITLAKKGYTDTDIADIEGIIRGRYVDRTTVWYSINRAKIDLLQQGQLNRAMRFGRDIPRLR